MVIEIKAGINAENMSEFNKPMKAAMPGVGDVPKSSSVIETSNALAGKGSSLKADSILRNAHGSSPVKG